MYYKRDGTDFKIFYSALKEAEELDDRGMSLYVVNRNQWGDCRIEYSEQEYVRLIKWLKDTFGD